MTDNLKDWLDKLITVIDYTLMEIDQRGNIDLEWERNQIDKLREELSEL